MTTAGDVHHHLVHTRRVAILAQLIAPLVPAGTSVLDLGCGDGRLAAHLGQLRRDLVIRGLEVHLRPDTLIPVTPFDGQTIPGADQSTDVVLMVDVLHHTEDPAALLAEAGRVARRLVIVKDHVREGWLAGPTLRFMDWVGNASHGVALPYNYWTRDEWRAGLTKAALAVTTWRTDLNLYPVPANWLFDRSLHFIATLEPIRQPRYPN